MPKNKAAQQLGRLSAKKRKGMGHDSEYYANLAKKRWEKRCRFGHICTSSCGNDRDCPCQADHCCALTEDCDGCDDHYTKSEEEV